MTKFIKPTMLMISVVVITVLLTWSSSTIQWSKGINTYHSYGQLNTTLKPVKESKIQHKRGAIYIVPHAGFGNNLFQFIAAYGIARHNNFHVIYHLKFKNLRAIFPLLNMRYTANASSFTYEMKAYAWGKFNVSLFNITSNVSNIHISGLFQSWRYFSMYEKDVRQMLQLKPTLVMAATTYLQKVSQDWLKHLWEFMSGGVIMFFLKELKQVLK